MAILETFDTFHRDADACARAVAVANDLQELTGIFGAYIESRGLNSFLIGEVTGRDQLAAQNLVFGSLDLGFVRKYWQGGSMFHDPMTKKTLKSNCPVRFSDIHTLKNLSKKAAKAVEIRMAYGMQDGIIFPLKGRLNCFAMAGIHGDISKCSSSDLMVLEMLCIALYRRATTLYPLPELEYPAQGVRLTKRERQCLIWVARGKTSLDIAQILMITERTVQYHIENARTKLGAESRLQAVILAAKSLEIIL